MAILCNEKEDYNFDFGLKMNKQFSNFIKSNDSDSQIITFELIKNNKNESIIGKYLLSILDDGKMESNNGYVINLGISDKKNPCRCIPVSIFKWIFGFLGNLLTILRVLKSGIVSVMSFLIALSIFSLTV